MDQGRPCDNKLDGYAELLQFSFCDSMEVEGFGRTECGQQTRRGEHADDWLTCHSATGPVDGREREPDRPSLTKHLLPSNRVEAAEVGPEQRSVEELCLNVSFTSVNQNAPSYPSRCTVPRL